MMKKNKHICAVLVAMNIMKETKKSLSASLRKANLSNNEWTVLKIIYLGYADTPSTIARELNIQKASTTRIVDALEKKKAIIRNYMETDKRSVKIRITKKGINLSETILSQYPNITQDVQKGIEGEERKLWSSMMGM